MRLVWCMVLIIGGKSIPVAMEQPDGPANGAGVMIAGELWDSFLPPNVGPSYVEATQAIDRSLLRIGNFDRAWSTPTHMWPGGWNYGNFWSKDLVLLEFNPDSTWNPPMISGQVNPSFTQNGGSRYGICGFAPSLHGAGDPARNYARETRWVDPARRHHALYEAGWPTTAGIDVAITIHQFTLNWNNLNDFIIVEIRLTNTGVIDMNADGIPDSLQTGRQGRNRIRAMTLLAHAEVFGSYILSTAGGRGSSLGSQRGIGYVGDSNPLGSPWDMMVYFPGESVPNLKDMGLNTFSRDRFYTDVWSAWAWVAAKSGGAPSALLHELPDKPTLYGTDPIGTGSERGWYATAGQGRGLDITPGNPRNLYVASTGAWYADGGRSRSLTQLNLAPNPAFFSAGTPGDPTTFVPKSNPARPDGDRKLLPGSREVNAWEPGWTKGFTAQQSFDGDMFSGIGPFSLDVGESMTIVWAEAGGFRLQGVQNAIEAARWAFDNGYALPDAPAVPVMQVQSTTRLTSRVFWNDASLHDVGFAGYKIWRVSALQHVDGLTTGMQEMDDYWRATVPGAVPDSLKKSVNPSFAAFDYVHDHYGAPGSWGPYELVANIPASGLSSMSDHSLSGYAYSWEDRKVNPGFDYWYAVSAYSTGSYTLGPTYGGLNNPATPTIETSNVNRNGASGLWENTYPFAVSSPSFPTTPEGLRAIGAGLTVGSMIFNPPGSATPVKIGVRPNPYKKAAFWDSRTDPFDHRVLFYNLSPGTTITILDVSGQVIDKLWYPLDALGSMYWDMFSKNGVEVASGLYIFVAEYPGGQEVGYFSILR